MKASAVLKNFKNFKTAQGFKDHCDEVNQNFPKSHKYKCDHCIYQNINEKWLTFFN